MEEAITLRDLVTNPSGKNTRNVGARYMIRDAITAKYTASLSDPITRKKYKVAVSRAADDFILWVKVPSEKYDVVYDVIFKLHFPDGVRATLGAEVQLYCNSPGWVFPVGYVAANSGLLIPGWKKALGRAGTEAPKVVNANLDYGFDKTTLRAILFILGPGGLITRKDLEASGSGNAPDPRDPKLSAESKLFEYNRAKEKQTLLARALRKGERLQKLEDEQKQRLQKRAAAFATRAKPKAASTAAKSSKTAKATSSVAKRKSRTAK